MLLWTIGAGLPLLFFAASLPLVLERVPPNRWFGFRTSFTLAHPANWYRTNRTFGISLLLASCFSALANAALALCFADGPIAPVSVWMANQSLGWVLLACVPPWLISRRPDALP